MNSAVKIENNVTPFITPHGDEMVIISKQEYQKLIQFANDAEDAFDLVSAQNALFDIEKGIDEVITWEMSKQLLKGDIHPVRIWRNFRKFNGKNFSKEARISAQYLSDIENFKRDAGLKVYIRMAQVLNVDIDALIPQQLLDK